MDPATFFAASRVVIVAGKGGVGKTTVTAALARAASLQGRRSLIVEVEGKSGLATMFGAPEVVLPSRSKNRTVSPRERTMERAASAESRSRAMISGL